MREPQNSWEVAYVISYKRPKIDIGMKKEQAFLTIGSARAKELREWAAKEFDGRWLKDHI